MTRRSFFSKFATVAGALLAAPKVVSGGFSGAQCGSPIWPNEHTWCWNHHVHNKLTMEYLNCHADDLARGRGSERIVHFTVDENLIWQAHNNHQALK